jgi:hypothetical protein
MQKNNTIDGDFTIMNGADDYKNIGLVKSWNGLE